MEMDLEQAGMNNNWPWILISRDGMLQGFVCCLSLVKLFWHAMSDASCILIKTDVCLDRNDI